MFLERYIDDKLPVTGSTMIFIGWHNASPLCFWPWSLSACRIPSHAALGNGVLCRVTHMLGKRSASTDGMLLERLR
jgi:hypothetical protein